MKPAVGITLDQRYELVAQVPDRGLGESWEAHDTQHEGRAVCVKLLRALQGAATMPRELTEHLKSLRAFRHGDVLAVINHGVWEGRPYLVYDRFEGRSIGSALDEARTSNALLEPALAGALFDRVCLTIDAAHRASRPLLHLGITPGCVLFRGGAGDMSVGVIDFGVERHASPDPTAPVRSARALLCPAPEQLSPDGRLGPHTDVFGLGGLLREMLSLPPQLGMTLSPAGLERRREDVPDALWDVVARAMATRPDDRFPTVEALRAAAVKAWREPVHQPTPAPIAPTFSTEPEELNTTEAPFTTADRLAVQSALEGRGRQVTVPGVQAQHPFPSAPMPPAGIRSSTQLNPGLTPVSGPLSVTRTHADPPQELPTFPQEDDSERFGRTMAIESTGLPDASPGDALLTDQPSTLQPPADDVESTQEMGHDDEFLRTMAVDQDALQVRAAAARNAPVPDVSAAHPVLRPPGPAAARPPLSSALGPPVAPRAAPRVDTPAPAKAPVVSTPADPSQSMRYKLIVAVGILFIPVLLGLFLILRSRR